VPPDQSGSGPGGPAGIADLFHTRHLELVRLATLLVGDRATAEDVVQDVFVNVCARWQRLTEAEIAESMGISRGTVKSTLSRGLDALGGKLGKQEC